VPGLDKMPGRDEMPAFVDVCAVDAWAGWMPGLDGCLGWMEELPARLMPGLDGCLGWMDGCLGWMDAWAG
jgi:hypothetical protein